MLTSISGKVTVGANFEGFLLFYTVPGGATFHVQEINVIGNSGIEGSARLRFHIGEAAFTPLSGYIYPTEEPITVPVDVTLTGGERIRIKAINDDPDNNHDVFIAVSGEYER